MSILLYVHLHRKLPSLISTDLQVNIKIHFDSSGNQADPTRSYSIKPLLSYSSSALSTETNASTKKPALSSPQEICCTDGQPNYNTVVRWPYLSYQNDTLLIFQFSLLMPSFMYRSIRFYFLYCPPRTRCRPSTVSCFDNLSNYTILCLFLSAAFPASNEYLQIFQTIQSNYTTGGKHSKHHPAQTTILHVPIVLSFPLYLHR